MMILPVFPARNKKQIIFAITEYIFFLFRFQQNVQ